MTSPSSLLSAYREFIKVAEPFVLITDEDGYQSALSALEEALVLHGDAEDSLLNPLIEMLIRAVEQYEEQDESMSAFLERTEKISVEVALLRTLMDQYKLTPSDIPEIGDSATVLEVLSGSRKLHRLEFENLTRRFGLKPDLFEGVTRETFRMTDEDREWMDAPPVGKEVL